MVLWCRGSHNCIGLIKIRRGLIKTKNCRAVKARVDEKTRNFSKTLLSDRIRENYEFEPGILDGSSAAHKYSLFYIAGV